MKQRSLSFDKETKDIGIQHDQSENLTTEIGIQYEHLYIPTRRILTKFGYISDLQHKMTFEDLCTLSILPSNKVRVNTKKLNQNIIQTIPFSNNIFSDYLIKQHPKESKQMEGMKQRLFVVEDEQGKIGNFRNQGNPEGIFEDEEKRKTSKLRNQNHPGGNSEEEEKGKIGNHQNKGIKDGYLKNEQLLPFIMDKDGIIWLKDYFKSDDFNLMNVDEEHPFKIDFYSFNKDYLKFIRGKFNGNKENLLNYKGILYEFSKIEFSSNFEGELYQVEEVTNETKSWVLKFTDKNKKPYVLKRSFFKIGNVTSEVKKKDVELKISRNYVEFVLMKLFSICPYSVEPVEIQFLYIVNLSYVVTEILMEYGGETLGSLIVSHLIKEEDIPLIFSQLVKALNHVESYRIRHKAIKPENIVIEYQGLIPEAKLMDFNISKHFSITYTNEHTQNLMGFTELHASPEIHSLNYSKVAYDPYLSQMYSFGMTILELLNFFELAEVNFGYFTDLTKYKSIKNDKRIKIYFEDFSSKLIKFNKPLSYKKIFEVCKICIAFESNERITANQLTQMLPALLNDEIGIESIINELNIFSSRNKEKLKLREDQKKECKKIENKFYESTLTNQNDSPEESNPFGLPDTQ